MIRCSEEEFDQFEEVDLSYLSSNTLTIRYETIPALDCLTSFIRKITFIIDLERLTICNHNISDLSPIIVLRKLKYVNLSNNNISNVRPLVQLYLLEELHLDHNNIYKFPRVKHAIQFQFRIFTNCIIYEFSLFHITKLRMIRFKIS